MKMIAFIIASIVHLSSCTDNDARDIIPGTYIRFSTHEFGNEYDTLLITLQNEAAGEFKIIRKWKYERVLDGQKIEPEYKRIVTTGFYDLKEKKLQEIETGNAYSFDEKKKVLFLGFTMYNRI